MGLDQQSRVPVQSLTNAFSAPTSVVEVTGFRTPDEVGALICGLGVRRRFPAVEWTSADCESIAMHADEVVGEQGVGDDILDRRHVARNASFGRIHRAHSRTVGVGKACRVLIVVANRLIEVRRNGTIGTWPHNRLGMSRRCDVGRGRSMQSSLSLLSR